MSSKMVVS